MYGAVIGDLSGSIYEYDQIKNIKNICVNNIIEVNSFYSDDTILTMEIIYAINDNKDYEFYLKKYINDYDTLELLKVFFMNNMNVLKSAKLLYIHRNTLINKLARFKEDTSFDPKEFRDAYIVYSLIK